MLSDTLREYIVACFTGLWVQSHEHDNALLVIAELCRQENWKLATWDVDEGLNILGQQTEEDSDGGGNDPLATIRSINAQASVEIRRITEFGLRLIIAVPRSDRRFLRSHSSRTSFHQIARRPAAPASRHVE